LAEIENNLMRSPCMKALSKKETNMPHKTTAALAAVLFFGGASFSRHTDAAAGGRLHQGNSRPHRAHHPLHGRARHLAALRSSTAASHRSSFNSVDLQFQELRSFQVIEIARALGVPPNLLMDFGRTHQPQAIRAVNGTPIRGQENLCPILWPPVQTKVTPRARPIRGSPVIKFSNERGSRKR
jgi:hypothetical protein